MYRCWLCVWRNEGEVKNHFDGGLMNVCVFAECFLNAAPVLSNWWRCLLKLQLKVLTNLFSHVHQHSQINQWSSPLIVLARMYFHGKWNTAFYVRYIYLKKVSLSVEQKTTKFSNLVVFCCLCSFLQFSWWMFYLFIYLLQGYDLNVIIWAAFLCHKFDNDVCSLSLHPRRTTECLKCIHTEL